MLRSERRHRRARAVARAFRVYWNSWSSAKDWADIRWRHERVILDGEQARRDMQDRHRADWMLNAKLWADHMKTCSCYVCTRHKHYEKPLGVKRQMSSLGEDWGELVDYLEAPTASCDEIAGNS